MSKRKGFEPMSADKHYLEEELETLVQTDPAIWQFLREGSLDGVWYWDLEDPEHEYMSPEFWQLFGFNPAEKKHLAAEWQDLIFPEDLELAKENVAKHCADPNHPYDQVVRYHCADGSVAWVRCRGIAIRNDAGVPTRLLGAHNDITAQKKEELAAATLSHELETIFNAATSGIVALTADGHVIRANDRARHFLGGISDPVPFAWPEGMKFLDAATLQPLDKRADPIQRALAGDTLQDETHVLRRAHAREDRRYVRVGSARPDLSDSSIHTVLVLDDISNEERNRQAFERKSRLDALGQLTGGIAHDFNNLLGSMVYAVDLARRAKTEDMLKKQLDRAMAAIDRGRSLNSRLLAFARKQPGRASVHQASSVFDEFESLIRPMLESQVEISFCLDEPGLSLYCDPNQLEMALMNLTLNARDAILRSGKGSKIEVRARSVRAPNQDVDNRQSGHGMDPASGTSYRYIEISVTDDGPGMDRDTVARCTDPFFSTKENSSGTGLGLAMVYGSIQQAGGDFRIYSDVGVGTTVQLILPRGSEKGGREEPQLQEATTHGNSETILVVEDEEHLLEVLTEVLEELDYKVISARSGPDALQVVDRGEHFDLLLTDVVMPGAFGGFELARRVRAIYPSTPILYTSGYTGYSVEEMGEVSAPVLQKPTLPHELATAITDALSRHVK
ncbi:hybrid sensor histidine kinase/response regulator [Shimia ponticola]|uniref:hybrid sensor histidine kinase/response regulator n=1 Tax=Shimia ponticola TaxID=2582893 RepID=UPI0011BFB3AF|nr:hybrid sensor histidine kinase/response regulator [Shimia ponticola]